VRRTGFSILASFSHVTADKHQNKEIVDKSEQENMDRKKSIVLQANSRCSHYSDCWPSVVLPRANRASTTRLFLMEQQKQHQFAHTPAQRVCVCMLTCAIHTFTQHACARMHTPTQCACHVCTGTPTQCACACMHLSMCEHIHIHLS